MADPSQCGVPYFFEDPFLVDVDFASHPHFDDPVSGSSDGL